MSWFKRTTKGIRTSTQDKKDTPQGLWYKSPTGKIIDTEELAENFYVSPEDGYHVRVGSQIYFDILFDEGKFREINGSAAMLCYLEPLDQIEISWSGYSQK